MSDRTDHELLADGTRAAFHGAPLDGVAALTRLLERESSGQAHWLLGVCLASAGRFGTALNTLAPLTELDPPAAPQARWAALSQTTAASCLRQLGQYERAYKHDARACRVAAEEPAVAFDAWIGLAADAVGIGDAGLAGERWATAVAAMCEADWRQAVRRGWVATEIALMTGDPVNAAAASQSAVRRSRSAQAPRHLAKSLLFKGVCAIELGQPERAKAPLAEAAVLASDLDLDPLVWPIESVRARLDRSEPDRHLATARSAVRRIRADLPGPLALAWEAAPAIVDLIGSRNSPS
ncbi:MAG: hypothetical protein ACOYD0_01040 [Candidatus Nanopelagicales bacterium]